MYTVPRQGNHRSHVVFVPNTGATRVSDRLDHFPDPLFHFETLSTQTLLDPSNSRPKPTYDGMDFVGRTFVDPELGVCRIVAPAELVFLFPQTRNFAPGVRLTPEWPSSSPTSPSLPLRCGWGYVSEDSSNVPPNVPPNGPHPHSSSTRLPLPTPHPAPEFTCHRQHHSSTSHHTSRLVETTVTRQSHHPARDFTATPPQHPPRVPA